MDFGYSLSRFGSVLLVLLAACQPRQQPEETRATPTARQVPAARPTAPLAPPHSAAPPAARPEKQTLFPDTLRPIELAVQYWTGPQVDSIRAVLDADSLAIDSRVMLWTARYRVLRADDDYSALRLFFRPLGQPARWVELDLNAWLGRHNELSYLTARAVELDQRPPEELLVELEGGSYAQGLREILDHTLLLSFDGPPRVIWHSLDTRIEEIPLNMFANNGEGEGGNYAELRREITVRRGRVRVGRVQAQGEFEDEQHPELTPITPGTYAYRAGRFLRVGQ